PLTLLQQSAWNGPGHPLDLRLRVGNTGDTVLAGLSITLTIETPTISRGEYANAMRSTSPRTAIVSFPFPQPGSIAPGAARTFRLRQNLDALTLTALYPVRVDLLSSLQPVATLRTPMVFLTQQPKLPLALTISWLLWEPLQVLPDGSLGPGPIEGAIAPGGRLDRTVRAIAKGPAAVALAISPVRTAELRLTARAGARTLLLDGSTVPPPSGLKFSPPPVAPVIAGGRTLTAIVPDPELARDIQTWIGAPTRGSPDRSALAARLALGELATIYLE